jgi:hypothetical protein
MLAMKARHGPVGKVRPFFEAKFGDSFDRDTGRWLRMEQVFDHVRRWRWKRLVDKNTGTVIRNEEGPDREHRPHTWRKPG